MTGSGPTLAALRNRRSVRFGFEDQPVPRTYLADILDCGLAAPSSKNAQPWRFHVVTDRTLLDRLAELVVTARRPEAWVPHDPRTSAPHDPYRSTVLESAGVLREVPAAIWVENLGPFSRGRKVLASAAPPALESALEGYGLEMIGIGAAVENMWIAANSLGLSAAFLGDVVIAEADVRSLLSFDGDLVGALAMGYSSGVPGPPADQRTFDGTERIVWH